MIQAKKVRVALGFESMQQAAKAEDFIFAYRNIWGSYRKLKMSCLGNLYMEVEKKDGMALREYKPTAADIKAKDWIVALY